MALSRPFECFFVPRLSAPGDRWCAVLGFVPAGSVSSFSTLQIFEKQGTCESCLACQSICSVISLHSGMSRNSHWSFRRWLPTIDTFQSGFSVGVRVEASFQALVYDTLPSTIAVFSYAIGSNKLSANEQFFLLVLKQ